MNNKYLYKATTKGIALIKKQQATSLVVLSSSELKNAFTPMISLIEDKLLSDILNFEYLNYSKKEYIKLKTQLQDLRHKRFPLLNSSQLLTLKETSCLYRSVKNNSLYCVGLSNDQEFDILYSINSNRQPFNKDQSLWCRNTKQELRYRKRFNNTLKYLIREIDSRINLV